MTLPFLPPYFGASALLFSKRDALAMDKEAPSL